MAGKFCCLTLQATSVGIYSQLVVVKRCFSFADDLHDQCRPWLKPKSNANTRKRRRGHLCFSFTLVWWIFTRSFHRGLRFLSENVHEQCPPGKLWSGRCNDCNLRCAILSGIFGKTFTIVDYSMWQDEKLTWLLAVFKFTFFHALFSGLCGCFRGWCLLLY